MNPMSIERFEELLRDPTKSYEQLRNMRNNAAGKGAVSYVTLAERILGERYPGWRTTSARGGSKPTTAMFRGEIRDFPSQKEAYSWLMDRFVAHCPNPFSKIDHQTVFIAKGQRTLYFARSLQKLFATSPEHASDPTKYHRMTHGWYAKLILNEPQKIEILSKFGAVAGLTFGKDWDWNGKGMGTPSADELLAELCYEPCLPQQVRNLKEIPGLHDLGCGRAT